MPTRLSTPARPGKWASTARKVSAGAPPTALTVCNWAGQAGQGAGGPPKQLEARALLAWARALAGGGRQSALLRGGPRLFGCMDAGLRRRRLWRLRTRGCQRRIERTARAALGFLHLASRITSSKQAPAACPAPSPAYLASAYPPLAPAPACHAREGCPCASPCLPPATVLLSTSLLHSQSQSPRRRQESLLWQLTATMRTPASQAAPSSSAQKSTRSSALVGRAMLKRTHGRPRSLTPPSSPSRIPPAPHNLRTPFHRKRELHLRKEGFVAAPPASAVGCSIAILTPPLATPLHFPRTRRVLYLQDHTGHCCGHL